jgi:hypothetical protein
VCVVTVVVVVLIDTVVVVVYFDNYLFNEKNIEFVVDVGKIHNYLNSFFCGSKCLLCELLCDINASVM